MLPEASRGSRSPADERGDHDPFPQLGPVDPEAFRSLDVGVHDALHATGRAHQLGVPQPFTIQGCRHHPIARTRSDGHLPYETRIHTLTTFVSEVHC